MSKIKSAFRSGKAFIPFVTCGDPSLEVTEEIVYAMADAGADLIIGGHTHTLQPVELLTASDGRDVPVYYSLGNFLSHQKEKMNLLGGMASVTIVKDADGTHVSEYDLKPTINVILRNENTGWDNDAPGQLRHGACRPEPLLRMHRRRHVGAV